MSLIESIPQCSKCSEVRSDVSSCVSNLRFADDTDLMRENTQDAQDILNSVHT